MYTQTDKDKAVLNYLGKRKFSTNPDKRIIKIRTPLWSLIKGKKNGS